MPAKDWLDNKGQKWADDTLPCPNGMATYEHCACSRADDDDHCLWCCRPRIEHVPEEESRSLVKKEEPDGK